jgi:predicted nucleotidyltransferase
MDREQAIAILREHEPELKAAGVLSMSIFGSVARNDTSPDSDIDIAVRVSENFSQGGFDYFDRMEELQRRLSSILGCRVDVIEEPVRKERLRISIEKDRALAF